MKKHLQKMGVHKRKAWNKRHANPLPLVFAGFFGLVMVVYGVTRLLAANPVIYSIAPGSQTAKAGDNKAVTIAVNPNSNTIRGGTVRVTFDANRFAFRSFVPTNDKTYTVFSQSNTASTLSFSFSTNFSTNQAANLGVLTLQAKPVSATTSTTLAFSAGNTTAYDGFIVKPNNHTVQLGSATITIQNIVTPPTEKCSLDASILKSDPRCVPCPTNASIIASNPACKSASNPTPRTPSQPTTPAPTTPEETPDTPSDQQNEEQQGSEEPTTVTGDESEDIVATTSSNKKPPVAAIAAIVGGLLLLGGGAFAFFMYRKPPKTTVDLPTGDRDLSAGLFDTAAAAAPAPPADSPFEEVIVEEEPVAPIPDSGAEPIDQQSEPEPAPQTAAAVAVPEPAQKIPLPEPAPAAAPAAQPQPQPAQAAPAPVQQPTPAPAAPPEPASQAPEPSDDEPADMFELAAEHPDSYGSAQLADAESAAPPEPPHKGKPA